MSNTEKSTQDYILRLTSSNMGAGDGNNEDQPTEVEPAFNPKVTHIIETFMKSTIDSKYLYEKGQEDKTDNSQS